MNDTLPILAFHRVLGNRQKRRPGQMYADRFNKLLTTLKKQFLILPLSEALLEYDKKHHEKKVLSITFDDGYKDNYSVALPILRHHNLKATFFVASGFLDGRWMWNDGIQRLF